MNEHLSEPGGVHFFRLERDRTGPINHPLSDYTRPLYDVNERRCQRQRDLPAHPTLEDIIEGTCTHWRSGTLNEQTLRNFFAPDLPLILAQGFELRQYLLDEADVLSIGEHAAARQEVLDTADYEVLTSHAAEVTRAD